VLADILVPGCAGGMASLISGIIFSDSGFGSARPMLKSSVKNIDILVPRIISTRAVSTVVLLLTVHNFFDQRIVD
jgi:hypothetical protein